MKPGIYQHFKGGQYEVLGTGKAEKTEEEVVIYKALQDKTHNGKFYPAGSLWTRPVADFLEEVDYNGKRTPRFVSLSSSPSAKPKFTIMNLLLLGAAPMFIFILNIALVYILGVGQYTWYMADTPLHFLGGISIALSTAYALNLLEKFEIIKINNKLIKFLTILFTVAAAAVFWEMYEFLNDSFYGTHFQPSIWDTMKDMIMGSLGGALAATILVFRKI